MTQIFSDNFNRANEELNASANWTEDTGDDWDVVGGDHLNNTSSTNPGICRTTTTAHAALADVEVSVKNFTAATFDGGPCVRMPAGAGGAETFYYADVFGSTFQIYRRDAGTDTAIGAAGSITLGANKIIKLKATGTGATVTLIGTYDGIEEVNTTDTSGSRITTAGQTGLLSWISAADADFDDFSVDDLLVPPGFPAHVLLPQSVM